MKWQNGYVVPSKGKYYSFIYAQDSTFIIRLIDLNIFMLIHKIHKCCEHGVVGNLQSF